MYGLCYVSGHRQVHDAMNLGVGTCHWWSLKHREVMGAKGASLEVQQPLSWGVWGSLPVVGDSEPRPGQQDHTASLQARSTTSHLPTNLSSAASPPLPPPAGCQRSGPRPGGRAPPPPHSPSEHGAGDDAAAAEWHSCSQQLHLSPGQGQSRCLSHTRRKCDRSRRSPFPACRQDALGRTGGMFEHWGLPLQWVPCSQCPSGLG